MVRSPRSAAPRIRFLFVDSRVRFTLRSAYASRRTPCASLRSLRPGSGRTFTSKSSPMPGPPQRPSPRSGRLCRCQQARRTRLRAYEADEPGPGRSLRLPRPSRPAHRERRSPVQGPERVPGPHRHPAHGSRSARRLTDDSIKQGETHEPGICEGPPASDASSSGYRTPRHISKILAEPALAQLLASSGEVNDE